jgi:type IV pilus biogenesis protein CpaD/CtpE
VNTTLRIRTPLAALLALLLSACASTPRWDSQAGDTVRTTLSAQVANPAAGLNPDPVRGIDGRAARAAQERYENSYKQAQEQTGAPSGMIGNK